MRVALPTLLVALLCSLGWPARAQAPMQVRVEDPGALPAGQAARITVHLTGLEDIDRDTLLVTPIGDGEAVDVVRGRLRGDEGHVDTGGLRFEVPVFARAPGAARLAVRVQGHHCTPTCRLVRSEGELMLRVRRDAP